MKTNAIILILGIAAVSFLSGCQSTTPGSLANFRVSNEAIAAPVSHNFTPSLLTLNDSQQLDEIVRQAPGVVLIDFYADWCKPCQRQGEILKKLETTARLNQSQIVKVNVDNHPDLAQKFKANALPTILVMKQGKVIERQQGLASAAKITSFLKR